MASCCFVVVVVVCCFIVVVFVGFFLFRRGSFFNLKVFKIKYNEI